MNKFYIDLGEKICTLYAADRNIVSYEEFDYPTDSKILDLLYSKMKNVPIEEGIVVLHGMLCAGNSGALTLGSVSVEEAQGDIQKLQHLFRALGIMKLAFFDYAGFYLFNAVGKNMFVSRRLQSLDLVVADGTNIITTESCSFHSFFSTAQVLKNRYELEAIVDVDRTAPSMLFKYFLNIDDVDEADDLDSFQHEISLFAFTMTTNSEAYKVIADESAAGRTGMVMEQGVNAFVGNGQDVLVPSQTGGFVNAGVQDNMPLASDKKFRRRRTMADNSKREKRGNTIPNALPVAVQDSEELPKQKKKKFGLPFKLSMFICVFMLIASIASKICSHEIKNFETKERELYYATCNQLAVNTAQLSAYKRLEDSGADLDNLTTLGSLDSEKFGKKTKIGVQKSDIIVDTYYDSKKEAEDFVQYLKKSYTVNSSEITKENKLWSCIVTVKSI